jgi:hypothetical protein
MFIQITGVPTVCGMKKIAPYVDIVKPQNMTHKRWNKWKLCVTMDAHIAEIRIQRIHIGSNTHPMNRH